MRHLEARVLSCLLLFVFAGSSAAAPGWINDGSGGPPRLSVEQSIWAMGGLPRGGPEWTLDEKVARIAEAGFDGFMVFLPAEEERERYRELAGSHGLAITLQCAPSTLEDFREALAAARGLAARAVVAMVRPAFVDFEEGARKVRGMMEASERAGLPFYLETHRGTITQDLLLTGRLAEEIPGIRFHADLSHFVVSYEVGSAPRGEVRRVFDAVLSRAGMLDGRVGNGEQVQIDIGPRGDTPSARRFASWWKQAMVAWLEDARPGDVFVFKSELGPPPYAIVSPDGREISDRWEQALVMRDLAIRTWNEAVAAAGRGRRYEKGAAKVTRKHQESEGRPAGEGGEGASGSGADKALAVEESPIRALRGQPCRIGDFHLTGQPTQPDLLIAKEKGVKTIINVRLPRELGGVGFEEERVAERLGLAYVYIPVGPESIDDELAERFLEAMRRVEKPVLLHGSNGNRVWGLWALWVGVEHGIPLDRTAEAAKKCGVRKLVIDDFVRDYLKRKKGIE